MNAISPIVGTTLDPRAQALVHDLVAGHDFMTACQRNRVDPAEVVAWEQQPDGAFERLIADVKEQVRDSGTPAARIRHRATRTVEETLSSMDELIKDRSVPPQARVSAFSSVKTLTGLDQPKDAAPLGRFELKIVLPEAGGGAVTIEGNLDSGAVEVDSSADGVGSADLSVPLSAAGSQRLTAARAAPAGRVAPTPAPRIHEAAAPAVAVPVSPGQAAEWARLVVALGGAS